MPSRMSKIMDPVKICKAIKRLSIKKISCLSSAKIYMRN